MGASAMERYRIGGSLPVIPFLLSKSCKKANDAKNQQACKNNIQQQIHGYFLLSLDVDTELANQIIHIIIVQTIVCDHVGLDLAKQFPASGFFTVVGSVDSSKIAVVVTGIHNVTSKFCFIFCFGVLLTVTLWHTEKSAKEGGNDRNHSPLGIS
jgi:hypothetical protein